MILEESEQTRLQAAEIVARVGVVAFRTDTFYGLGANPFNREAIKRIKAVKGREATKPILIVVSELDQVARFISDPSLAFDRLAEKFWPGPLTLIGKATKEVPDEITAGTKTVGLRLPADDSVRALVRACGGALTATSANPAGKPPARTAREVESYFGTTIDLIVDAGEARSERPSTVVDVSADEPVLIREGVIAWAEIQKELNRDAASG